jgi:hypothetical protein
LKDLLLSHEAHTRHPYYIEQLGVLMYLMKLRYWDHFGKRASGSCCWRLIFVYAWMPWWMHQYRIHVRKDEAGLLFQSQSSDEAGRKAFGLFSQGRRGGGPTHDKNNDTGDAKSPISIF